MATPYFQLRFDTVPSTQDIAREHLEELPVLVVASSQSAGRGRLGTEWVNADRALAASLAFKTSEADRRPFSLIAGVAAARAIDGNVMLKWPNDLIADGCKVGGILVERSSDVVVVGLGVNLYWPDPPEGLAGLHDEDPGEELHAELAGLWGAELMALLEKEEWPIHEYRDLCTTVGSDITWQPDGRGHAKDIALDGGLVVELPDGEMTIIYSGEVHRVVGDE
jgi:BirA family biotin operon repressor/biotin-[acetyl-CoA-carboxylase] ligase